MECIHFFYLVKTVDDDDVVRAGASIFLFRDTLKLIGGRCECQCMFGIWVAAGLGLGLRKLYSFYYVVMRVVAWELIKFLILFSFTFFLPFTFSIVFHFPYFFFSSYFLSFGTTILTHEFHSDHPLLGGLIQILDSNILDYITSFLRNPLPNIFNPKESTVKPIPNIK